MKDWGIEPLPKLDLFHSQCVGRWKAGWFGMTRDLFYRKAQWDLLLGKKGEDWTSAM